MLFLDQDNFKTKIEYLIHRSVTNLSYMLPYGYSLPPTIIRFRITYHCNSSCMMCPYHGKAGEYPEIKGGSELSFEEIKYILDNVRRTYKFLPYKPKIIISGGEPFLKKEIVKIIDYVSSLNFECIITTNGLLISDEQIKKMALYKNLLLCVSINGEKQINDLIRGKGSYDKIMGLIKKLKKNGTKILFLTSITDKNYTELYKIYKIANKLGINLHFTHYHFLNKDFHDKQLKKSEEFFGIKVRGFYDIIEKMRIDTNKIKEDISKMRKDKERRIDIQFLPKLPLDEVSEYYTNLDNYRIKEDCKFMYQAVVIQPDGYLTPCLNIPITNLKDNDYKIKFNHPKMRKFRMILKAEELPACYRCCRF